MNINKEAHKFNEELRKEARQEIIDLVISIDHVESLKKNAIANYNNGGSAKAYLDINLSRKISNQLSKYTDNQICETVQDTLCDRLGCYYASVDTTRWLFWIDVEITIKYSEHDVKSLQSNN
jgi:hypothetical protein